MESLEEQLLALHLADTLKETGGGVFSSAQSDTEGGGEDNEIMDEPLPLAKIDAREERRTAAPLRQRLRGGHPVMGESAKTEEERARDFREWIDRVDNNTTFPSSSSSTQQKQLRTAGSSSKPMRGSNQEEADRARALRDWADPADDEYNETFSSKLSHHRHHGREGDDDDDIALAGAAASMEAPIPPDPHIQGLWSWWKGLWSYTLYPISSEKVEHVPQAIRGGGDVSLVSTGTMESISINPEGGGTASHRLNVKKIQGVSDVLVYEANFEVHRNNFFKLDNDPIFVTISFPHPVTLKPKEMRLMVDRASRDTLKKSRTWATVPDRAGDSLVLRFSRGSNPVLRQVFVLFRGADSLNASAATAAAASGLSDKEYQLATHILAGTLVPLESLHDTHTIADAGAACIALGTAASHVTARFSHISLPALHISHPKEPTTSSRNAMVLFKQYANVLANLGTVKQATGVVNATMIAQERGHVLADYICAQLAGVAAQEKITQVLQSLTNVSEVFYMRETHGTAQDVRERVNKFRIVKDRTNAKQLYSQFFG